MTTMIWNFIIIGAVVMIFLILIRRLPIAAKYMQEEKKDLPAEKIVSYGIMAQAEDAFEARDFTKAENLYIKMAAQEPNNAKVYNRLGVIYLDQKNYYDAKDAFLQSIKLEPDNINLYDNLGTAYMGLKDYFKAGQAFMKLIESDPKNKKYREIYEKSQKALEREKKNRR